MLEKIKSTLPLILIAILAAAIIGLPQLLETISMNNFAKPLHFHAVPENTTIYHKGVQYVDDDSSKIAVMLLETRMSEEEIKAFYADILETEEAEKKDLILEVEKMAEGDLDVIKEEGHFREDMDYYFVYIYGDSLAKPLFLHPEPDNSRIYLENTYYHDDKDMKTAEICLGTTLSPEELEAFYADVLQDDISQEYQLTLEVKPLEGEAMERVKLQEDYDDTLEYYAVCLNAE